jgi:hypothetical protein
VAYKQKLCLDCFSTNAVVLLANAEANPLSCPACHMPTEDCMDAVFLTYVVPGGGKQRGEFATCGPCAVEVRNRAIDGAELMPDREVGVGASAPTQTPVSGWDALGLRPLR